MGGTAYQPLDIKEKDPETHRPPPMKSLGIAYGTVTQGEPASWPKTPTPPPAFTLSWSSLIIATFVVCVGAIGTLQSAVNHQAGEHYGTFLIGTWVSFLGGVVVLAGAVLGEMWRHGFPFLRFTHCPRWFHCLPGAMGMVYVSASVGLTTVTGFTLFFIAAVVGQLFLSATLDQMGWLGSKKLPLSRQKILALATAIGGAILSSADRLTAHETDSSVGQVIGCVCLAVLAGAMLPVQAALNRQCSEMLPSKLQTALFSFTVGLLTSTLVTVVYLMAHSDVIAAIPDNFATSEWWMYAGGPGGVLFIASGIWFVRSIGSAAFFISLVCGQLGGSATIDATGFVGSTVQQATTFRIVGIVCVAASAALMQFDIPFSTFFCCRRVGETKERALLMGPSGDTESTFPQDQPVLGV